MKSWDSKKIAFGLFSLAIVVLAGYNIKSYVKFFETPLYSILNLLVAVIFAYFFTQKKNDERKLKENAENLINKIQVKLNDPRAYKILSKEDANHLKIIQRDVDNIINILDSVKEKLNSVDEINYIKSNFLSYTEISGNHIEDIDYLVKSEKDLLNKITLIDNKLDFIKINFYK